MSAEMLLSLNARAGIDKTVLVQAYSASNLTITAPRIALPTILPTSPVCEHPRPAATRHAGQFELLGKRARHARPPPVHYHGNRGNVARRPANLSGLGTCQLARHPDLHNGAVPSDSARSIGAGTFSKRLGGARSPGG